jgi:hypothetical protein
MVNIKVAQKAPPAPRSRRNISTTPAAAPTRGPAAPLSGVNPGAGNSAVKQMQSAILGFAKTLASTPVGSMQPGGAQTHQRGEDQEYLGGTDPFGEFLTNHYVNKKPSGGQQYVNVDLKSPTRTETATPNKSFKGVISTIARIGTPGAEHKVDGIWMERTNNALHEIYDVGKAILSFANDLGIPIKGYSQKQLDDFGTSIPKSYADIKGREGEFAQSFTPHINALTQVAQQFKKYVLENKQYSDYITQEKSVGKYDSNKTGLTADEQKLLQSNMKTSIPGVSIDVPGTDGQKGYTVPVALQNISNVENFKDFLKSLKINADDPKVLNSYITSVKGKLTQSTEEGPGY